jgi:3-deoxy-manno-octulosonate cytidylyltransferase (CMP-KDO synthetase)
MRAVGVIPARYAASRLPGKPLVPVGGVPLLQRVWQGAAQAKRLARLIVATDDRRVADACRSFGAEVVLTSPQHPTGTDRVAEVATGLSEEIVVNVQGDEALIEGHVVDAVVTALESDPLAPMATLVHAADPDALDDPHRVKVVLDRRGRALYFSRSRIPYARDRGSSIRYWQHVGLYAYRRPFLLEFVGLGRGAAEQAEGLEQLRALEHGHPIRVAVVDGWRSLPVDVPADVARAEARLRELGRC